jgi:gas vesicle protein
MRLLIGLAIGFGIGFAGAVLFAPDRARRREVDWPAGSVDAGPTAIETNHNVLAAVRRALRSAQEQLNEALDEAKEAQAKAEKELRARYERKVHKANKPEEIEEKKRK